MSLSSYSGHSTINSTPKLRKGRGTYAASFPLYPKHVCGPPIHNSPLISFSLPWFLTIFALTPGKNLPAEPRVPIFWEGCCCEMIWFKNQRRVGVRGGEGVHHAAESSFCHPYEISVNQSKKTKQQKVETEENAPYTCPIAAPGRTLVNWEVSSAESGAALLMTILTLVRSYRFTWGCYINVKCQQRMRRRGLNLGTLHIKTICGGTTLLLILLWEWDWARRSEIYGRWVILCVWIPLSKDVELNLEFVLMTMDSCQYIFISLGEKVLRGGDLRRWITSYASRVVWAGVRSVRSRGNLQ